MDISYTALRDRLARDTAAVIRESEEGYRRKVADVVDRVLGDPRRRIILLAGPSSSGKTTTAALLSSELLARGHRAHVLSLDDFYRPLDAPDYPRDEHGLPDYETVDALEVGEIHDCLGTLLDGGEYPVPRFDFTLRRRVEERTPLRLAEGDLLVVEGLHALNPRLSAGLAEEGLFRLFISVSTNLLDGEGERVLTGRKMRFVRRLVRDFYHRASDAARTYTLWQSVVRGEEKYLYPYRGTADVAIDTFHPYEVGVLRPMAERLLAADGAPRTAYVDVIRRALRGFAPLERECVPPTSLLCEFLPRDGV